jgi:glycosyltransferase involved in cell wall biosynthesis
MNFDLQKNPILPNTTRNCDLGEVPAGDIRTNCEERPLVTFALFAYNQEKYVREAIEAAFSQTYEPMEIILSDDCSTDGTFEIMKEMTNSYRGSKKVVARKTRRNVGVLLHVKDVANIAEGKLLILAAGDDISKKERTEIIANEWMVTGAWGFCSKFDRINERGEIISEANDPSSLFPPKYKLRHYFTSIPDKIEIIHGATSAYDKRIFNFLDLNATDYILSEDGVLSVLLNLLGKKIKIIDSSMVSYRENEQSLTNSGKNRKISLEIIQSDELKIERFARSQANRCDLFIRFNDKFGTELRQLNTALIRNDLIKQRMREKWRETGLRERLSYLKRNFSYDEIKWAMPRTFSVPIFLLLKTLIKKIL